MPLSRDVYIVSAVRTPSGRRGGGLSGYHPADLAGTALLAAVERAGVDPAAVEDVILGCVAQIGAQAWNIARIAWLSAGLPEHVPGVTIDRQCGSSQQAISFGAQAIASGAHEIIAAGGVEVMSLVTLNSSGDVGPQLGFRGPVDGDGWLERYGDVEIHQFRGGEEIAEKWGIERSDMEQLALRSHQRAAAAWDEDRFPEEVVAVDGVQRDEGIRRDTTLEKMSTVKPLRDGYRLTAATTSQIADGASAVILASEDAVREHDLQPLARIHTTAVVGSDPILILTGPIPATRSVLEKSGLSIDDIDLFECNEAFSSVVLAWAKEMEVDMDRVNVNGGAIALGHPLGASGARLMTTLVHELRRRGGRYGLQTMCEGGGLGNATIVEAV